VAACCRSTPLKHEMRSDPLWGFGLYVGLAFGLSWTCWIPAVLSDQGMRSPPIQWLVYAGILGPALAGLVLVYFVDDKARRADYWARAVQFRRLRSAWLVPIFLIYPAATAVAFVLAYAVAGHGPDLQQAKHFAWNPLSIPGFMLWTLMLGPLPEELGWRGYALDRLQQKWTALTSSLMLGLIWATWHMPLFLVKGSYQNNLVLGSLSSGVYCVTIVLLSVLFTWIYNNNNRSTLSAILLHFVLNLTGTILPGFPLADAFKALVLAMVVAVVAVRWKSQTLVRAAQRTVGCFRP